MTTDTTPTRIQRSRAKGSTTPPNTRYCGRPGPFGNPFSILQMRCIYASQTDAAAASVAAHRRWLRTTDTGRAVAARARRELAGYAHLSCWCPLGQPCHVDNIIELLAETTENQGDDE